MFKCSNNHRGNSSNNLYFQKNYTLLRIGLPPEKYFKNSKKILMFLILDKSYVLIPLIEEDEDIDQRKRTQCVTKM